MTKLPHRFREASVSKYERFIALAVSKWPEPVQTDPRPLAGTTFAARMRDAMLSLKQHQWTLHGLIDMDKFNHIYGELDDLAVSDRGDTVFAGSRNSLKSTEPLSAGRSADKPAQFIIGDPSAEEIRALAILCAARRLPNSLLPVRLVGGINPEQIAALEDAYDISFEKQPDGSYDLV